MKDRARGYLAVGCDSQNQIIVINHPDVKPYAEGVGHIVFSPAQARHFAKVLLKHAQEAEDRNKEMYKPKRRKL